MSEVFNFDPFEQKRYQHPEPVFEAEQQFPNSLPQTLKNLELGQSVRIKVSNSPDWFQFTLVEANTWSVDCSKRSGLMPIIYSLQAGEIRDLSLGRGGGHNIEMDDPYLSTYKTDKGPHFYVRLANNAIQITANGTYPSAIARGKVPETGPMGTRIDLTDEREQLIHGQTSRFHEHIDQTLARTVSREELRGGIEFGPEDGTLQITYTGAPVTIGVEADPSLFEIDRREGKWVVITTKGLRHVRPVALPATALILGRGPESDASDGKNFYIDSPFCSRMQCRVSIEGNQISIQSLSKTSKTRLGEGIDINPFRSHRNPEKTPEEMNAERKDRLTNQHPYLGELFDKRQPTRGYMDMIKTVANQKIDPMDLGISSSQLEEHGLRDGTKRSFGNVYSVVGIIRGRTTDGKEFLILVKDIDQAPGVIIDYQDYKSFMEQLKK